MRRSRAFRHAIPHIDEMGFQLIAEGFDLKPPLSIKRPQKSLLTTPTHPEVGEHKLQLKE